jgi:hypothetical protein
MTSSVAARDAVDFAPTPYLVRRSVILGIIQALIVALFAVATRMVDGPLEKLLEAILLIIGLAATILLPGIWTRPRTIEGIAGAAGIGLGATVVFLLLDVALLQPLGAYTFRWRALGGGSNWWYHPVWWMAGTYLAWMGAFIMANQARRDGKPSVGGVITLVAVGAAVFGALAVLIHFPGARWSVPTFGVAVLPGLALAAIVTGLMARRP